MNEIIPKGSLPIRDKQVFVQYFFKAYLKAPVLGTLPNFEKFPVLGFPVLEDFEKFQKKSLCWGFFSPVCALCWGTLKNFKKFHMEIPPLCVGFVVCGDFENFQNFSVCGPCAVWRL